MNFSVKRKQINTENRGITDIAEDNIRSLTRRGYFHHSGTEFTNDLVGEFGNFISSLIGDSSVLELGCGSGVISNFCKEYIGLDANICGGNCCTGEFYSVDLTKPFEFDPPIKVDFILSFNFLEHVEEEFVVELLKSADGMLNPGGRIFFIIDNAVQPEHVTVKEDGWWGNHLRELGWIKEEVTVEMHHQYVSSMPTHWKGWNLQNTQRLFLYRKPINENNN